MFIKKKLNVSGLKIRRTFNKYSFLKKKLFFVNKNFYLNIYLNFFKLPRKNKKWIRRRLFRKFFLKNFRNFLFIDLVGIEKYFYLFKMIFYKFVYFVFLSLQYYVITDNLLELLRRLARKIFGKRAYLFFFIKAEKKIYVRSAQMRMGGGKASKIKKFVYFLYPGCCIFEVRTVRYKFLLSFLKRLTSKLSFKYKVLLKNKI